MSPLTALLERRQGALVMGILNRTPDSFSDGGRFVAETSAREHVRQMIAEGADLIDVGAESTRPGAPPVAAQEQIARLGTSVREAASAGALVSVDTTLPEVAEHALREGARVVNSVSLEAAAELGALAARHGASLVLMHSRGSMTEMAGFSKYADDAYGDVVSDVGRELCEAAGRAVAAGLPRQDVVVDPGLGFAKNARHSLELVRRLDALCALGFPVLVGPSRKSFLVVGQASARAGGAPLPATPPPGARLGATIAAVLACVERGAAIVRVHDVAPVRQALDLAALVSRGRTSNETGGRHG